MSQHLMTGSLRHYKQHKFVYKQLQTHNSRILVPTHKKKKLRAIYERWSQSAALRMNVLIGSIVSAWSVRKSSLTPFAVNIPSA
jgi:hypothetical protein